MNPLQALDQNLAAGRDWVRDNPALLNAAIAEALKLPMPLSAFAILGIQASLVSALEGIQSEEPTT